MSGSPKLLFIDIETAPILAAVWNIFEADAIWVERDTFILSFAYKWHGRRTETKALPDYKGYRDRKHNDKPLVRDLWTLLNECDVAVAHNGAAFDIKKINSRFAVHGFKPPAPYKIYDTLQVARKVFRFDSNKLDNLGRYLKEGRKIPNTGAALWRGCVDGNRDSWRIMRKYNAQDVDLLVRVYNRLKPWDPSHPNLSIYDDRPGCPVCRSEKIYRMGYKVFQKRKAPRFQCQSCGHWFCK